MVFFFSATPLLLLLLTTLFLQKSTEAMKTLAGASLVPLTQRGGGGVQPHVPPKSVSFVNGAGGSASSKNLSVKSSGGNGVKPIAAEDSNGSKMIQEVQKNRKMLNMAIKEHVVEEDVDMVANLMAHMGDSNEAQHMMEAHDLLTVLGMEEKMLEVIGPIEKIIAERENKEKDGHQVVLNQAELDKIASHQENLNEIREFNPNEDYDTIGSTTLTKMIQGAGNFIASVKGTAGVELNGQAEAGVKKFEAVEALKERAGDIHNLLFRYDQEKKRNKKGDKKILLKLKETPESITRLYEPHGVKQ